MAKKKVENPQEAKAPKESKLPKATPKTEFWARQIRMNGRTVTGLVKPEDKAEFLKECKKNGVEVDESKWFLKNDWRERVFKKYVEKKK